MAHFSHSEFCEGQPGHQAPYPKCHPGSDGEIPLGFDPIVDEVSNEFFFYGSSHPHHHEEMFFPSDLFIRLQVGLSSWSKQIEEAMKTLLVFAMQWRTGCITHDLIVEILRVTNQYPAREEWLLSVYGADEFLQNNCTLGSHEILRKASTCIQLCLHHTGDLKPSLARTCGDDQRRFCVNELLEDICAWRLVWQNLVSVIMKYRGQVEYLLQNENNVDNVIEAAKAICSVLGFVETRDITDAVRKLRALVKAQSLGTDDVESDDTDDAETDDTELMIE
ncbi:hypothetical protein TURU_152229 [Turdus rufiventris]|nr:hypothetical protein TURU_152229 [Turdus rufiventris]